MEFDKSKVYTAVNADELEAGDVVIAADTLHDLTESVKTGEDVREIMSIESSDCTYRFTVTGYVEYALAYLIAKHDDPYKEFAKAQAEGKDIWYRNNDGEWHPGKHYSFSYPVDRYSLTEPEGYEEYKVFLYESTFVFARSGIPADAHIYYTTSNKDTASRWCNAHQKFASPAKAWEDGKQIQFLEDGQWYDIDNPEWLSNREYRIKPAPLKWTDLKIGDSIKKGNITAMITGIDTDGKSRITESYMHIHTCLGWLSDDNLTEWEVVNA